MKRDGRKIPIIIADHDSQVRDHARAALAGEADIQIIADCSNGTDAVRAIQAYRPELVLLGAQMPAGGALHVIEQVGPDRMPHVIFLTSAEDDMVRALDAHALDYVLTPVAAAPMTAAVTKVRGRLAHGAVADRLNERLADFLANREAPANGETQDGPALTRFMIRERDRIRFIAADEVDWIEGARNYVRLHVGDRSHLLRGPLTAIHAQLDPAMFVRIHRSIIVNVERIGEVQPWVGGDYVAILRSGERLRVSRNFRETVVPMAARAS